jgi:hypothetical protein
MKKDAFVEHRIDLTGHLLNAWTTRMEDGWTWSYTIDDEAMVESSLQKNLPEAMVLDEAIGHAKRAINAR